MELKILSAPNIIALEQKANELDIQQVGSVAVSNGHFFLAALVKPKAVRQKSKVIQSEPKETEVKPKETEVKPKTTRKRRSSKTNSSSA